MAHSSKQIMSRFVDEAWNKKNREILFELLTPDFRHYIPGVKKPFVGPEAYGQLIDSFSVAFPKNRMEITEVFGEGPRVCMMWVFHGSHKGEFDGIAPTGRRIKLPGIGVARVQRGKLEEVVSLYDSASLRAMLL